MWRVQEGRCGGGTAGEGTGGEVWRVQEGRCLHIAIAMCLSLCGAGRGDDV